MTALRNLLERRANLWSNYQEVLTRATDEGFSPEDREQLDRMDGELNNLTNDIERIQRAETIDVRVEESQGAEEGRDGLSADAPSEERYAEAFGSFLRHGVQGVEAEERQLLQDGFVSGDQLRAQGVATDAAGGYLVPEGFRAIITETMKAFGGVRQVANVITTTTGNNLPWPTNDDTGNKGAILGENTAAPEQDVTLGQNTLGAHMYTSKLVRVSFQLLQDSAFDLDTWLPGKLGERIGRIHNEHFTTGTGTGQPEGVQTNATVGKTGATGQTTSVTYDDLIDLEHSVNSAYRNERAVYMFADSVLAKLRKIKDADSRPLWQPSVIAGTPSLLNGRPYVVNDDMPAMAASVKSILFGDFNAGYIVRDVSAVQVLRLTERYADFLQVGFLGFARADATPDDGAAIRAYQNSAT